MGEIVLFPKHEDYCMKCKYHREKTGECTNEKYKQNMYKVCCVWKYCPYRKEKIDGRREGC